MFYDDDKTKEENRESRERTQHNRDCVLLVTALIALGTGLLALAMTSHKAAKEFY